MKFLFITFIAVAVALSVLPHLAYALCRIVGHFTNLHVKYRPFLVVNVFLILFWGLTIAYGYYFGRFRHEVKNVELTYETLPASFDGLRLVHISDLHLDSWTGHEDYLQLIVKHINELQPDIICFTGDLVSLRAEEIRRFLPILQEIKTRPGGYGVFSVLGNHDYMPYAYKKDRRKSMEDRQQLIALERDTLGWQLLMNDNAIISNVKDSIAILGCENQSVGFHSVIRRGNLEKTIGGTAADGMFSILLTHDPTQWRKEVVGKTAIPLTLSGHTHAMQFRIMGFTPVRVVYPDSDGLYTDGTQNLYVNIGLGGTMPWRVGATPEITLITLRSQR